MTPCVVPTYSSWLNQVERFFSLITDKAIRRGSFTSARQLVRRIDHFVGRQQHQLPAFQVDCHRRLDSRKAASTLRTYQRDKTLAALLFLSVLIDQCTSLYHSSCFD
jgi:hypothetical protein